MTQQQRGSDEEVVEIVKRKAQSYLELGVKVAEFGTRRRHSYEVHTIVADALKKYGGNSYVGTSNVHLAMKTKVKTIGTHAHEWFMYHGARFGIKVANGISLDRWVNSYKCVFIIVLCEYFTIVLFF